MITSSLEALDLSADKPKICIPLTAGDIAGFSTQLLVCESMPGDFYEWRLDMYSGDADLALQVYHKATERPLICTLRTKSQGGGAELGPEEYAERVRELIESMGSLFQFIDIELWLGDDMVRELAGAAHEIGLGVIVSQHDFNATPPEEEMTETLLHMHELGADLPKLAVTPLSPKDVLALMSASAAAYSSIGPVISMSMGQMGQLSRVGGMLTGSCITFGAGAQASAPGQLGADELRQVLDILGCGPRKEIYEYEE